MIDGPLLIGTRGSELALAQSGLIVQQLASAGIEAELVVIKTTGDRIQDRPLHQIGGKGLFLKEIEEALLEEEIHLAIHSLKDMPAELHPELRIGAVPAREDARDVLVVRDVGITCLEELPEGSVVATGSLRRSSQLKRLRPDIQIVGIRGNVGTRLEKLRAGVDSMAATILAAAGLNRLGLDVEGAIPLSTDKMLPAVGQGALCIEARADSFELEEVLLTLHDSQTSTCVSAEREFLERLGGSCTTPIAGYGVIEGHELRLRGLVAGPDGTPWFERELVSPQAYARRTGGALAEQLLTDGAAVVLT
jgi:hydroxymethylbilane synthase